MGKKKKTGERASQQRRGLTGTGRKWGGWKELFVKWRIGTLESDADSFYFFLRACLFLNSRLKEISSARRGPCKGKGYNREREK